METILTIRRPDDMHVHFRMGRTLKAVSLYTAEVFGRTVPMPNPVERLIGTGPDAVRYCDYITRYLGSRYDCQMIKTIKLTDQTTPKDIEMAWALGVRAAKLYPIGTTTGSATGVTISEIHKLHPVFRRMEKLGMILLIHGEMPGADLMEAEREFLPVLAALAKRYPDLKIVLEHVSTREGVDMVCKLGKNVAATITVHHMAKTTSAAVENNYYKCRPVLQSDRDQLAVLWAAISGNPKFFFGSDSAPHPIDTKERAKASWGIFHPGRVDMAKLAQDFEELDKLDMLENFTSRFGAEFYGLPLNEDTITLIREPWIVPTTYSGFVPFMAGETLYWRIAA